MLSPQCVHPAGASARPAVPIHPLITGARPGLHKATSLQTPPATAVPTPPSSFCPGVGKTQTMRFFPAPALPAHDEAASHAEPGEPGLLPASGEAPSHPRRLPVAGSPPGEQARCAHVFATHSNVNRVITI